MHISILPTTTRLFFVLSLSLGFLFYRFTIGNFGCLRLKIHLVTLFYTGKHNIQMHIPHAGKDSVPRFRVFTKTQSTILFQYLVDRIPQFIFIRSAFRANGQTIDRFREGNSPKNARLPLYAECGSDAGALQFGNCNDIPDEHLFGFLPLFAS